MRTMAYAIGVLLVLLIIATLVSCGPEAGALKAAARFADELATAAAPGDGSGLQKPREVTILSQMADVQAVVARLEGLQVARRGSQTDYDRDDWRHWVDEDRDCQNTRAEVLIAESLEAVEFAGGEDCRVVGGKWLAPWSGEVFVAANDVDIDHHVPLGHAHESGGWRWNERRKMEFANDLGDPASLQTTKASVNRAKGKQPPDQWRPDDVRGWCGYAADWIAVKSRWELTVTQAEKSALSEMLDTCSEERSWGLAGKRQE